MHVGPAVSARCLRTQGTTPNAPRRPESDGGTDGGEAGAASSDTGDEAGSVETGENAGDEENPGQAFGEGYLMWRCTACGEMGELDDGLPEECPNCGEPTEALAKQRED